MIVTMADGSVSCNGVDVEKGQLFYASKVGFFVGAGLFTKTERGVQKTEAGVFDPPFDANETWDSDRVRIEGFVPIAKKPEPKPEPRFDVTRAALARFKKYHERYFQYAYRDDPCPSCFETEFMARGPVFSLSKKDLREIREVYAKDLSEIEAPEGFEFTGEFQIVDESDGSSFLSNSETAMHSFNLGERRLILRELPKRLRVILEEVTGRGPVAGDFYESPSGVLADVVRDLFVGSRVFSRRDETF